jgi:hypothetical protein
MNACQTPRLDFFLRVNQEFEMKRQKVTPSELLGILNAELKKRTSLDSTAAFTLQYGAGRPFNDNYHCSWGEIPLMLAIRKAVHERYEVDWI